MFHASHIYLRQNQHLMWSPRASYFKLPVHALIFFQRICGYPTLGAKDFSCAVSGFGQAFVVTRAAFTRGLPARDFGLRTTPKRPAAREKKPLVPRVM